MLELAIKDKTYEFTFDYGFVKEVNDEFGVTYQNTLKMRTGLQMVITTLTEIGDPQTLVDVLMLSNKGKKPRVRIEDLNDYIMENGTEELLDKVLKELETSGFTSADFKKVMKTVEEAPETIETENF